MNAKDVLILEEKNQSFAHAYLFVGNDEEEISKLIDYIIEKKECLKDDISTLEPAANETGKAAEIKVDDVREILHTAHLSPQGRSRLIIIKNCEKLNPSSGNILLKILEEPPARLTIILTAQTKSVLPTIKSRCRVVNVNGAAKKSETKIQFKEFFDQNFFESSTQFEKMAKENKVEYFLNGLVEHLQAELLNSKSQSVVLALKKTLQTKKEIAGNANPRLALECLFLTLKKELYA